MSSDFIPSQPEGVYLYPFLQACWSALGATVTNDGAGAFPHYPAFSFTWLQIQQIPGTRKGKFQTTSFFLRKLSPPTPHLRRGRASKIYDQAPSMRTGLYPALCNRERHYAFPLLIFLPQPPLQQAVFVTSTWVFDSSDKISDGSELNSASRFPTLLFERLSCLYSRRFPSFVQYIALDGDSLTTEDRSHDSPIFNFWGLSVLFSIWLYH